MSAPSQSELAAALGVDPALVTRYKRRGMPVDSIAAAQAWKAKNVRARVGGRPGKGKGDGAAPPAAVPGYGDHRARREAAEADKAELEAQRMAAQLMPVEPAERAVFDAFRELRDSTFAAMRGAAPQVLGLTEVREVQHLLEDALRGAYADFEARVRHRLGEVAKP
jgi:hypothetical protein